MQVFKAPQAQVLAALQSVAGVVERRQTLPILSNVLLRKQGETLELLTSPYDLLGFKDAITSCMSKGTARHVETEDTGANPPKPMTAARSRGSSSTPARSSATRAKSTT